MIKYETGMNIGIFDSGIGGGAIAKTLNKLLPSANIIFINDSKNMPYGNRKQTEIIELTHSAIQPLIKMGCNSIIIACNTATTVAISSLRKTYPNVNFIGIEPMVKPASILTKTKRIAVFATPRTLQSDKYNELKKLWTKDLDVFEPDCSDWASLIEHNEAEKIDLNTLIKSLIDQNVDVIVLGCTHYHWIKQRIIDISGPNVKVIEPSDAIAARVKEMN
jgi:glutamate racemase